MRARTLSWLWTLGRCGASRRLTPEARSSVLAASPPPHSSEVGKTRMVGLTLADLGEELIARIIDSCRSREPSIAAVLVHGSYATGVAHPESDLDLDLFVSEPAVHYRTWFESRGEQAPLHVSARCDLTLKTWEHEANEPEQWSLGLPVRLVHRWLWCGDPDLATALGDDPVVAKPGGSPEIEDMVDAVLKMRRHAHAADDVGVRLEAQTAARCAAPTVGALNDSAPATDPRSAIEGVVSLPVAPRGWGPDFLTAAGLAHASVDQVLEATNRLVIGTLRLVREVDPAVDDQPDIERYVRDGTLERLLS